MMAIPFKSVLVFSTIGLTILFAGSCNKLTPVCESGEVPTYLRDIRPIIQNNCVGSGCHNSGSEHGDFTTYYDLHQTIMTREFSKRVLKRQDMPKGRPLTQEEINLIQCWEDTGYLED